MGVRNRIKGAAGDILGFAGESMTALSENQFWKAEAGGKDGMDIEDQERAPGGDNPDTVEAAPPPDIPADDDPKTLFWDPFSVIEQLGFKERRAAVMARTAFGKFRRALRELVSWPGADTAEVDKELRDLMEAVQR